MVGAVGRWLNPVEVLGDQPGEYRVIINKEIMNKEKLLERILSGSKNVRFDDFVSLVEGFGFELKRTRGSHHIFEHPDITEILNLQNSKGQAKPYQIRQFLKLVEQYNLELED